MDVFTQFLITFGIVGIFQLIILYLYLNCHSLIAMFIYERGKILRGIKKKVMDRVNLALGNFTVMSKAKYLRIHETKNEKKENRRKY